MQKTIITTVGTSLITNFLETPNKIVKDAYEALKNAPFYGLSDEEAYEHLKSVKKIINPLSNSTSCAEISSILAIEKLLKADNNNVDTSIHLLCTDSILSPLCAEIIANYLREKDYSVYFHENKENVISEIKNSSFNSNYIIKDLRIDDKDKFEKKGLVTLIQKFYSIIENNYEFDVFTNEYIPSCVLNITGGYKGLIPYLTIFSQISKVKIVYLFEETNKVMEIPQTNISIDWNFIAKNSNIFSDLDSGVMLSSNEDWTTYKKINNIADVFDNYYISIKENEYTLIGLNAIGTILHKELEKYFFIDIPTNSRYFKDDVNIKAEVNKAVKDLYYKLQNLSVSFDTLTDPLIKHCPIENSTNVYKDTSFHVRIHYGYSESDKKLSIINYYFKRETEEYNKRFKQEYNLYKDVSMISLPFEKINHN